MLPITLDTKDRLLLRFLQQNFTMSLQVLAEHICLTTTPCWKRLKRLKDEGYIRERVALLDSKKLGLDVTAFVVIKTYQHSRNWFKQFVSAVRAMPEVMALYRMAGEYDYLLRVQVPNIKSYDAFYKKLLNRVPALLDVTSSFSMEEIIHTTALPVST